MELMLNVVWLAVAATAFAHVVRSHTRRQTLPLVALACVLVLLFPVISISDDLAAERSNLSKDFPLVVAIFVLTISMIALGRMESRLLVAHAPQPRTLADPRSPPVR